MAIKKSVKKAPAKKNNSVKYTNMFAAYRAFWRRGYTEWAGTSSRSEYWLSWLVNMLFLVLWTVLFMLVFFIDGEQAMEDFILLSFTFGHLFLWVAFVPAISMFTRRMHDAGLSAWFWLLGLFCLVPVIGKYIWEIWVLIVGLLPTRTADNPYHKYNK